MWGVRQGGGLACGETGRGAGGTGWGGDWQGGWRQGPGGGLLIFPGAFTQGAPALPRDKFSAEFCDFISKCLLKDAQHRPSVQEMSRWGGKSASKWMTSSKTGWHRGRGGWPSFESVDRTISLRI